MCQVSLIAKTKDDFLGNKMKGDVIYGAWEVGLWVVFLEL